MTYNFDPDAWYDRELDALEARRDRGELTDEQFEQEQKKLDERYEQLVATASMPHDYKDQSKQ